MKIPLLSLAKQKERLGESLNRAVQKVMDSGVFILGPEVRQFEAEFAAALQAREAIGVSDGTNALRIALQALGVGPKDEVILPSFTFIATATAISSLGATPVFADIDPISMNLDPVSAAKAVTPRTKALLPVHIFGFPADMDGLTALAKEKGLKIIEDCAQAHLSAFKGRAVGTIGNAGAFSFYPSKNLGAAGDAGAVTTQDPDLAEIIRELGNCGRVTGGPAYQHVRIGYTSRLDEIQAAVLRVKLTHLAQWTASRRRIAQRYIQDLQGLPLRLPELGTAGTKHTFHLFVIRCEKRDLLAQHLSKQGIGNGVYYPIPVHRQPVYEGLGKGLSLPHTDEASRTALALPMFPELEESEVDAVCRAVKEFFA